MALISHMPSFGCEHLTKDNLEKIKAARVAGKSTFDPDFVQYTCLSCPTTGSFSNLDKHFTKSKHEFAITSKSIYCARCNDLVYEPSLLKINARKRKLAQLSEEDESYLSVNTTAKPCGREGVRGLFNLGETCYMNAVLQMMVHNPLLANYFLGMGHPLHVCPISKEPEKKNESDDSDDENGDEKDQKTCVACAMTELFSDTSMIDQTTPAHAVNLLFASWKHIPDMSGKGQQDAQEWFTIIIDKLHDSAINPAQNPAVKPTSRHCQCFFHKVFYGRFYSDVTCDTCHNATTTESEYSSIDLDFQKQKKRKKKQLNHAKDAAAASTENNKKSKDAAAAAAAAAITPIPNLSECLKAYTATEPLEQEIECKPCGSKRAAHKRLRVRKLPAILTLHVKRFGMKKSSNGVIPEKYEGKLDFPLTLDMGPYTMNSAAATPAAAAPNGTPSKKEKSKGKDGAKGGANAASTAAGAGAGGGGSTESNAAGGDRYIYDLDCVVVHQGDHAHTGHYYAFCRQQQGGPLAGSTCGVAGVGSSTTLDTTNNTGSSGAQQVNGDAKTGGEDGKDAGDASGDSASVSNSRWFRFDDEIVSATTTEDVLRQEAYLLFYGLRELSGGGSGSKE